MLPVKSDVAVRYLQHLDEGPLLSRLVLEKTDFSDGRFGATLEFDEMGGNWRSASGPPSGEDYEQPLVPILSKFLAGGVSRSGIISGMPLPVDFERRLNHSNKGVLKRLNRETGTRVESYFVLPKSASVENVRDAITYASDEPSLGLMAALDSASLPPDGSSIDEQVLSLIAENILGLYFHTFSYDGYLVWLRDDLNISDA